MKRSRVSLLIAAAFVLAPMVASAQVVGTPANVSLKAAITDADGRITLGDLFDNAGTAANVVIGARTGAVAVLDAASVQVAAGRAGLRWDNPRGLRRIIVNAGMDGTPSVAAAPVVPVSGTTAPASVTQTANNASQNRDVLVFSHPMNTGDIVKPEDLQFTQVLAQAVSGDLANSAPSAIGKVVRWPERQGGLVRMTDLMAAVVVKKAESVSVTWSSNGLSLTMSGIAQKDAAIGDLIQVQNPTSKKMIDALITGPGQAVSGQAADQMRSQMLLSSR